MKENDDSWKKFLDPGSLRGNLLTIALFITAFEIFKDRIIEKPEVFFSDGFDKDGLIVGEEYKNRVLSKHKSRLQASLLWFREAGAVDDNDIVIFDGIRKHRNEVTHELHIFLTNANKNLDETKFKELIDLLKKIEMWWFINFEAAIDPEILPDGAKPEDVIPGPILSLQLMMDIALGNEPEEGYYYKAFKKMKPKSSSF